MLTGLRKPFLIRACLNTGSPSTAFGTRRLMRVPQFFCCRLTRPGPARDTLDWRRRRFHRHAPELDRELAGDGNNGLLPDPMLREMVIVDGLGRWVVPDSGTGVSLYETVF